MFRYFEKQFELAEATQLPMFLHCRNASENMVDLLKKHRDRFTGGVVGGTNITIIYKAKSIFPPLLRKDCGCFYFILLKKLH